MISFILPTRNRPERLRETLDALGALSLPEGADVIVVDNASETRLELAPSLANGARVRVIHLCQNLGAASRNVGVEAARTPWVVMLDDDSHPVEAAEPFAATAARLLSQPEEVAAVTADIHLPRRGCREAGGLPEVFVGCGVAIRTESFLLAGGYDRSFGYYAEEYDLAARFILRGWRVAFDPAFVVHHHKVEAGRNMDLILARLIRNNGWVMQRYAPEAERAEMLGRQRERYRAIAVKERAVEGYERGFGELEATLDAQARTPMARWLWDRFTGLAHAREALDLATHGMRPPSVAIVEPGKNAWAVERAVSDLGASGALETAEADRADALIPGTLSPGPMLDAASRLSGGGARVILPWVGARSAAPIPRPLRAVA